MRLPRPALPLALALALAACTGGTSALSDDTVVVDVRTAAEYAEGHLQGAVNVDVQDAGFADAVAELDPGVPYVVYCRSGNRSAAAAATMVAAGLEVTDAGSISDAATSTGLDVVTD
ncbi:Rhodanese domain protein [Cellulomonas flavigena DSM 20109]|uniref:Rhodanese domain protein n=1 Tax=Cellulomonas flavigena (strain ATCC 482 / DSM 20109 / BCRC 11376 / JCM 18109 / NBRC 3775 / NCIMB 8073 / NRS 134) TaxID=446466 RepID=D5UF01_CELFN|nr:rhodanese-like domain-containing protein [Cellulomonas flavigena]ADG74811.1 Rhodanese domain protein [Cellulomonas flavigena DSM 20109]